MTRTRTIASLFVLVLAGCSEGAPAQLEGQATAASRDSIHLNAADPKLPFINTAKRPDPNMTVLGADFRMLNNYLGNFADAVQSAGIETMEALCPPLICRTTK